MRTDLIEFKNGEVWSYKTRDGETNSRLAILDFSKGISENKIVHIRLTGVAIRNPNHENGIQTSLPHLAIFESALRESVLKLSDDAEINQESLTNVADWKKYSDGRAFIVPVAKCLQVIELGIQRAAMALPVGSTPEDWCCGLPLVEERQLTAEERSQIAKRLLKHGRLGFGLLSFSLGTCVVPLIIFWALQGEGTVSRVLFGLSMLSCLWVGFTFPKSVGELAKYKKLKICLNTGIVRRFEGILDLRPLSRIRALRSLGQYLQTESPEKQSLEILSPSNIVFRANGNPVSSHIRLSSGRVSQPGFSKMSASVLKYSSALGQTNSMEIRKRHLTFDEKEELKNHCAQIVWRVTWMGLLRLLIGAACTLGFLVALTTWMSWRPEEIRRPLLYFPFAIGMAWALQFAWKELRFSYWLRKSERLGFIVIVDEIESTSNAPMVEHLPFKRILWTWYGKPATWRIHLSRRTTKSG